MVMLWISLIIIGLLWPCGNCDTLSEGDSLERHRAYLERTEELLRTLQVADTILAKRTPAALEHDTLPVVRSGSVDDEGLTEDRQKLAEYVLTGDGVKHKKNNLGANEDEDPIEVAINQLQKTTSETSSDREKLHALAQAIAAAGYSPPQFAGLDDTGRSTVRSILDRGRRLSYASKSTTRWQNGIVIYTFQSNSPLSPVLESNTRLAMRYIESISCVRFVEYYSGVHAALGLSHTTYLEYGEFGGCWSYVGAVFTNAQPIAPCGQYGIETPLHEILHAMAGIHEQSRSDRDAWIQILYDNIATDDQNNFDREADGEDHVPYDYGSIMQYSLASFSTNAKDTMNIYDKKLEFLLGQRDADLSFLDRESINVEYSCRASECSSFSIECQNEGFVGFVNDQCQCVCPHGTMGSDCTAILTSIPAPDSWPSGSFSLPQPDMGCPDGFTTGQRYTKTQYFSASNGDHFPANTVSNTHVDQQFCSKDYSTTYDWPAGRYCIFRRGGSCPSGFEEGSIQFDDADVSDPNSLSGDVPDGVFDENTLLFYCCRNDGFELTTIDLPLDQPFFLMKHHSASSCQAVTGAAYDEGYIAYRSAGEGIAALNHPTPGVDAYLTSYNFIWIPYCFYQPITYDCGSLVSLTSANPSITLTSPNYPSPYGVNMECFSLVKSPPNTLIKVELLDFDIEAAGSSCEDSLEIRHHLISQPGERYCGDYFPSSIISNYNSTMLVFHSNDNSAANKGFRARLSIVEVTSLKYDASDKGMTYYGSVNYTKSYQPCLNWTSVARACPVNPFRTDFAVGVDFDNYCRNPNGAEEPWCYIDADTCDTDFCDVSGINNCYDGMRGCEEALNEDPSFCETDPTAFTQCHQTCGLCGSGVENPASECNPPVSSPYASLSSESSSGPYLLGDAIELTCGAQFGFQTRFCLTDGSWSGTDRICGACPMGWASRDNSCYRYFGEEVTHSEAREACESLGASLVTIADADEQALVDSIAELWYWIGLDDLTVEGQFTWVDGTALSSQAYTNWANGQPGSAWYEDAVYVNEGVWLATYFAFVRPYVCEGTLGSLCSDSRRDCDAIISSHPDTCTQHLEFAASFCRRSCGLCPPGSSDIAIPSTAATTASTTLNPTTTTPTTTPTTTTTTPTTTTSPTPTTTSPTTTTTSPTTITTSPTTTATSPPTTSARTCREGFSNFGLSCYAHISASKNFNAASHFCQNSNAFLVSISSSEEHTFVKTLLGVASKVFIGITDVETEGTFIYVEDGKDVTYTSWNVGQPVAKHDCVFMKKTGYKYSSINCKSKAQFVCEYSLGDESTYLGPIPSSTDINRDFGSRRRVIIPRPLEYLPAGKITELLMYPKNKANVNVLILRTKAGGLGGYSLVGEILARGKANQMNRLVLNSPFEVEAGDVVGIYHAKGNPVGYATDTICEYGPNGVAYNMRLSTIRQRGVTTSATDECRKYFLQVVVT